MTDTYELPGLPETKTEHYYWVGDPPQRAYYFTADQMKEYALLAVKAERERAARIVMSRAPRDGVADATPWLQCAAAIRKG